MSDTQPDLTHCTTWIDHIPVIWFEPQVKHSKRQLIIFLHHLGGSKETTVPFLHNLAERGYVALSFDAWQHGERGSRLLFLRLEDHTEPGIIRAGRRTVGLTLCGNVGGNCNPSPLEMGHGAHKQGKPPTVVAIGPHGATSLGPDRGGLETGGQVSYPGGDSVMQRPLGWC